ncbi:MAG TPA: GDSL-type esterase/lipase family protein [Pirellulales bacterium]|nr:GDSL-type esterase/lipase family protein [Pirellulales bacterium]
MRTLAPLIFLALLSNSPTLAAAAERDAVVIDSMDELPPGVPTEKVAVRSVEGKIGRAANIRFDDDCQGVYVQTRSRGTAEWDEAEGFSFWVQGDGSDHLGGIEFVWNDDYALRYAFAFPIDSTEWRKIVVRWRDLVPETANPAAVPIDAKGGNAPSKLGAIWFGKWWYWRDYAAHSYAIDQIQLEYAIDAGDQDHRPAAAPLARVGAKIARKEPIKIVLMGDSLTDLHHWANREQNWPAMLKDRLAAIGVDATIINTAIGGTELRQNLVLIPRWSRKDQDADLVVVCFGGNDWSSGMRGPMFEQTNRDAIDRIRYATGGGADVLICTTCPGVERWDTMAELSSACRAAARAKNAALADIDAAFHSAARNVDERERLFVPDKTHLSPAGHRLFAATVFERLRTP